MIDPKSLLPEVQKLLPQAPPQEIMAGIAQFQKAHPDLNNEHALQALSAYLGQQQQAPAGKPFEGLISQLGGK